MNLQVSTKNLSQGFVIGVVLTTFGIAILIASFQIDKDPGGGWGARIFPMFGSITLLMAGILELRFGLRNTQTKPDYIPSNILVLFGLAIGYIFFYRQDWILTQHRASGTTDIFSFWCKKPYWSFCFCCFMPCGLSSDLF